MSQLSWDNLSPEDYYSAECEYSDCVDRKKKMEHVADHFQGILDNLYKSKEIDLVRLEFNIEEVCSALQLALPRNELNIKREGYIT